MMVFCKKMTPEARLPKQASRDAACYDLFATHSALIYPDMGGTISTGLAFDLPPGYAMMVYSRSGMGFKHGIRLGNCVGVIDADYKGEVFVRLYNDGKQPFAVEAGDRIAQAMLIQVPLHYEFEEVETLNQSERGAGGMGSTGK
jgi:dUTP pyrophosphatase